MDAPVALHEMTFNHRDEFHRKDIAENIIKLLDADVDFCPMVIDGGWGTGKTEFCHKLINLIKEQDAARRASVQPATDTPPTEAGQGGESHPENTQQPERAVIYLDAFASETVDDPLLCILAAIRAQFSEVEDKETRKKISQRAASVAKVVSKVILKAAAGHLLKQDGEGMAVEVANAASESANTLIDQTVDKLLDQYADAQENIEALKTTLKTAAATRPIIFFIDELDRCRPDFALSILELVKHVFEVPGIKFVFVANMEQLKAVIRKRYGQDVDADVYLEKFVNLSIVLPPLDNHTQQNAAYMLFEKKLQHTGLFEGESIFRDLSLHLIEKYNIRLRGVEKIIKNINIYNTISNTNQFSKDNIFIDNFIFLLSIFIFTLDKDLANKIIFEKIDNKLFEFIGETKYRLLNDIAFLTTNIIYYGHDFSLDMLELTVEDRKNMQTLFNSLSYNRLSFCDFVKNYTKHCIRTMNMLSING